IRFKCNLQNTIIDVLRDRGWTEVKDESDWDFYWCDVGWLRENFDHMFMEEHVRICHFRNHYELTRKNLMAKNLKRLRKQIEREQGKVEATKCDFFPTTYELPSEFHIFVEEFKRNPGSTWIMKPVAKSQGKGIFLFRKLTDIPDWCKKKGMDAPDTYIVQRYVESPYLIGGRKFDMRIYVLVTTYIPIKAYLYREGFARFSNTRYNLESIEDSYIHLTNVAIQKTAPDYDSEKGCKWSLDSLRKYLTAKHGIESLETLLQAITNIFIKSLQSVQRVIINDKHCFELYGFDILIDANLKPWLLEINASPSLTASSQSDYEMKVRLLEDVLNVVDMENKLTGKEKRVGGFDLIWDDGPVTKEDVGFDSISSSCTLLMIINIYKGCLNDREQQLKQMYKQQQNKAAATQSNN
ncbi:uncharacterized protein TRIADDRAFT_23726, partial [Trichoplax adhaerens]